MPVRSELAEAVSGIKNFDKLTNGDKIQFFAWFLFHSGTEWFTISNIRQCYNDLHMSRPTSFTGYLDRLVRNRMLIQKGGAYCLERSTQDKLNQLYGSRAATVTVHKLLKDLPAKIQSLNERTFLDETIACFKAGAFRSSIVMTWNLAFHHLCDFILRTDVAGFTNNWTTKYPKSKIATITEPMQFGEYLKEFEVIELAKMTKLINKPQKQILNEALVKRNQAAHPSGVIFTQLDAEHYITHIINNFVLVLK